MMNLDDSMKSFRLASRGLFNRFFLVDDPYKNDGWALEDRFSQVEAVLFEQLVAVPHGLVGCAYGIHQPAIRVALGQDFAPVMINREIDSGYWDHPVRELTRDAGLSFVRFFDWDLLAVRDNAYVRVNIDDWSSQPGAVGKHALVATQSVVFRQA
jgi:hypothetical protein